MTELNETMRDAALVGESFAATPAGSAIGMEVRQPVKPAGKWAALINYDPEKGTRESDFQTPMEDYVKRFNARESFTVEGKGPVQPEFQGVFMEPVIEGRAFQRWRPRLVEGMGHLKQYFESAEGKTKRFIEQFGIDPISSDDPFMSSGLSATRLIDQGDFVPLMNGPFYKQLYIYDYLLMHSRAFQLVNHNALAAAAVKIMTRFVLGRGIGFTIKNDQARAVWEEFWERNKLKKKLRLLARDFTWQGELLIRYYEPREGFMTLRCMDASSCWEVVTDPEDVEQVYYYHFQYPTPYQVWVTGNIPVSKYIIQQVPPTNIQHVTQNISAQEKRGRSDLLPGMAWLKRTDDFYNGMTVKALLEANLVWKVKVKGDQADVDAFLSNQAFTELPPPGGMWIENEAVSLEAQSANMSSGARGSQGIGQQLANFFALSLNLPAEWFNLEGGPAPSRATALVRTDPAVKAIEDRQQIFRETIEEMYDRVMTAALIAGRITRKAAREDPHMGPGEDDEDDDDDARTVRSVPVAGSAPVMASEPVMRSRAIRLR